ncbi:MAG: hypothetical protein HY569_02285 [Candidatus Magasanikbacteria bacterium]|nr:hypothetical protein [Candidatus Magasanikbacteria bacterium]
MNRSAYIWGLLGAGGIILVFYSVQALGMQSLSGPYYFFQKNWYFISPLIILFAIQVGLWQRMREVVKISSSPAFVSLRRGKPVAASGGVSTSAMIACCMHNFVGVMSIAGISGLAVFFAAYQNYIFLISILFSFGGLVYMVYKYKKIKAHCADMPKV